MLRVFACFLAVLCVPTVALAHGRPPFVGDIAFHPTNPDVIVARMTFGLLVSEDRGETWRWICAAATGADPTREDPPIAVMPDGSILVGTFGGLARSASDHCSFELPEALRDRFVIDVQPEAMSPGTVWAIATSGSDPDEVYRSVDQGQTFARVGAPVDDILLERVRVAPSDPTRVYLSGAVPVMPIVYDGGVPDGGPTTTERLGFFLRSSNGGETFEPIEMPLVDEERNVHLLAVDPTNPDRVLVRMTRRVIDDREERVLLTEDAGDTWTPVASGRQISGGAFSPDGTRAWVTSRILDGLFRSEDGGRSFTQLQRLSLPCLEMSGDEVWICVDELVEGYAMARSTDDGETLEPTLHFMDIYQMVECSACTQVGHGCPEWFPDIAYDLRLDAGTRVPDGGISGAPRDAGPIPETCGMDGSVPPTMDAGVDAGPDVEPPPEGCNCRVGGGSSSPPMWLAALALVGLLRRRG